MIQTHSSAGIAQNPVLSAAFLFDIGEMVCYNHRSKSTPCKVIKRRKVKDHFLSQVGGKPVYFNSYITEQEIKIHERVSKRMWDDPELLLISADTSKPDLAVDYESDEWSADFIDKDGNVLKTVKAGKSGYAHELVSGLLLGSR